MNAAEFAEQAILVPFVERGRSWDGWDCYGLCACFYRDVRGVELPSYDESYESVAAHRQILRAVAKGKRLWRRVDNAREGDVAVILRRSLPIHVGIVLDGGTILHCEERVGTVIEPAERMRIEGAYRWDGAEEDP